MAAAFDALRAEAETTGSVPGNPWKNADEATRAQYLADAATFRAAVAKREAELTRSLSAEEKALIAELRDPADRLVAVTGTKPIAAMVADLKKAGAPIIPRPPVNAQRAPAPASTAVRPPEALQVLDWASLTADPPQPPPVLRPGLPMVGVTLLAGSPKVGKTLMAGQWALESGLRTLMVIEEGGLAGLVYRLTRQAAGLGIPEPPIRLIHRRRVRLDDRRSVRLVRDVVHSFRPAIIIFDPLNRLHGSDENKPMQMTAVMDRLSEIAQDFKCAVLTIHHLAKPNSERKGAVWDRFRGASSIRSATDANLALDGVSADSVTLHGEFRDAEPLLEHYTLNRESLLFTSGHAAPDDYDGPGGTLADAITSVLASGHATPDEIADAIGEPNNKVRAVLSRYKHRFNRLASGRWELLPEPPE